jgi:hypothetical protein
VGALIMKVEQRPQFKAGIGNRKFNPIGSGLLLCFRYEAMLVYVKDTPDLIVSEVRVLPALCLSISGLFLLNGPLYQSLWLTARIKYQIYDAPFKMAGLLKVAGLRQRALANDQESRKGRAEGTSAAQGITLVTL